MTGLRPAIEVALATQIPELLSFCARCAEAPHWPASAWGVLLGAAEAPGKVCRVFVLRGDTGQMTGWVAGSVVGPTAELEFLLVMPEHRCRGAGRTLLQAMLSWMGTQGATEVLLEVRASNQAARQLYRSVGFEGLGTRKQYYREPVEDAVCMRLDLRQAPCS